MNKQNGKVKTTDWDKVVLYSIISFIIIIMIGMIGMIVLDIVCILFGLWCGFSLVRGLIKK